MKFIILPILRFLALIGIYLFAYPLVFVCTSLNAFWHWDSSRIMTIKNSVWGEADDDGDYIYKTGLDWYLRRKTKNDSEPDSFLN